MRTFLAWIAVACVASAQEMPPPAKELARYDRLIGTWEGSGTASMAGGETMPWTAVSHTRRVMGGHFIRTDTRIDTQGEDAGTLGFITFYAWDPEKERHTYYELSNMGSLMDGEIVWLDENTMMTMSVTQAMGQHSVERWITKLGPDSHDFVGEQASGNGPWHVHVRGSMKKAAEEKAVDLADLGSFMTAPAPEMSAALEMAGTYGIDGTFKMDPEQPAMEFSGQETAWPLFGGTALAFTSSGQPGDWKGWGVLVYDSARKSYRMVGVSSMGMAHMSEGSLVGNDWVFASADTFEKTPGAHRMVMTVDEEGHLIKATSHSLTGTADPYVGFKGTYEFTAEVGTRPAGAERETEDR